MNILIIDSTSESQAAIASRIRSLSSEELDAMDITLQLSHPAHFDEKVLDCDLLILGPELDSFAHQLSLKASEANKDLSILRFVYRQQYSEEAFRSSYHSRVKKVLTTDASNLDILQELVATYEDLCEQGKKLRGKSIVVTQAKGGVGASTIAAGLSQASASSGATTLLWDLDIESRDVTRALDCPAFSNVAFRRILEEKEKLSRQSFRECCYPLDTSFHILPPPNSMAACMDMIGNIECLPLVQRIFHLANATHENVIVDTAGRLSPTTCALMLSADINLVVIDDSVLGLTAVDPVVRYLLTVIPDHSRIRFVCSGTSLPVEEIQKSLEGMLTEYHEKTWSLPPVPFDKSAQTWPLVQGSIYESGSLEMKATLDEIAHQLGLIKAPQHRREEKKGKLSLVKDSKFIRPFFLKNVGNA